MKAFAICFFMLAPVMSMAALSGPSFNVNGDSTKQSVLKYRTRNGLIIVPAIINDTIHVNLILDPHCRTPVLFGKHYEKLLQRFGKYVSVRKDQDKSKLSSLHSYHTIQIGIASEKDIPIVVMPNNNPLNFFTSVNGVIGYDILSQFEVVLDRKSQTMIIRPDEKRIASNTKRINFSKN